MWGEIAPDTASFEQIFKWRAARSAQNDQGLAIISVRRRKRLTFHDCRIRKMLHR